MSNRRPALLMGVLLMLVLGYVSQQWWRPAIFGDGLPPALPGENRISSVRVTEADGRWWAEIDYYYRGGQRWAGVSVAPAGPQVTAAVAQTGGPLITAHQNAVPGAQRARVEIMRPRSRDPLISTHVVVELQGLKPKVLAKLEHAHRIDWPDTQTYYLDQQWAGKSEQELLAQAVRLIDQGDRDSVREARILLERLLTKNPRHAAGYIEMARVAMKTNWGPEGLYQADAYLDSAFQAQPDSVDAKILLGYVRAHQGRHKEADQLLAEASRSSTRNLWLWVNWGELREMQRNAAGAIEMYRTALAAPRSGESHDRARLFAFDRALRLLDQKRDLDGMEALHRQRNGEYGEGGCHAAAYARFLLVERADPARAIATGRSAQAKECPSIQPRDVLGMAHYVVWATATEADREAALNQGRVLLPPGPRQIYLLATSDVTAKALRQLVAGGEKIDRQDNDKYNAVLMALHREDHAALRRLVKLGARLDAPVGGEGLPVALVPVVMRDLAGIRLMQQLGVDYGKLRHQGATALDMARQFGDRKLLDLLDRKSNSL